MLEGGEEGEEGEEEGDEEVDSHDIDNEEELIDPDEPQTDIIF